MGDWSIKKEIEALAKSIENEKQLATTKYQQNQIDQRTYNQTLTELNNQFAARLSQLRNEYRRIDILIKREKAK